MSQSASDLPKNPSLEQLRKQAKTLLRQVRAGDAGGVERFDRVKPGLADARGRATRLADAQFIVAREHGFETWAALVRHVESIEEQRAVEEAAAVTHGLSSKRPYYRIDTARNTLEPQQRLSNRDWEAILRVIQERRITGLNAAGQITDDVLKAVSQIHHVTRLNLEGSRKLTDRGLQHLADMPQLEQLNLSGWHLRITDKGLTVLRHLTSLQRFQMCWPRRISDAGVAHLKHCPELESVDLMGTPTGDGAIAALSGKTRLRTFKTGRLVTDAGIPMLHDLPVFKSWKGGDVHYALMEADCKPNHLLLDGPFTDKGFARITGLEGVFGLSFFWHLGAGFTPEGLRGLTNLPNLGYLGCEGKLCNDTAMQYIASIPRLRMLMAQGSVASDTGFKKLSNSQTIEYFWGRECPNLRGPGFTALTNMGSLRGIALSCKHVDDVALASLERFPRLEAIMPMDVHDAGFRHIGKCERLEALWCMYCRETGDDATAHIRRLPRLKTYYAGKTRITDRSLEMLASMHSLEELHFWECDSITDAGVAALVGLPKLRVLTVERSKGVTRSGVTSFPSTVRINYS